MTDHPDNGIEGETILWADASLESIEADYEEFVVRAREEAGGNRLLEITLINGCRLWVFASRFWSERIVLKQ